MRDGVEVFNVVRSCRAGGGRIDSRRAIMLDQAMVPTTVSWRARDRPRAVPLTRMRLAWHQKLLAHAETIHC